MDRKILLERVKACVLKVEPNAEVVLYGSRSCGESNSYSDWDFLILVDGELDPARTDAIRHRIYELEWDSDEVLSSIVRTRDYWENPKHKAMPFYKNVTEHGIHI
ncbi:MAG: hypothetical protein B6245_07345 [Desulfobacteraceae bacterium 4572_88]|nr:MAG: hypothetical protein B6245_07345 [Desulfobacteraceae bacterium 4572_88]